MAKDNDGWVPGNPNDRSIAGFRIRHGGSRGPMSKFKYQALKRAGRAPRETELNGMILISQKAEAEWERRNERPTGTLARLVRKEAEWRLDRAKHAVSYRRAKHEG
jgi:hypothetical protein